MKTNILDLHDEILGYLFYSKFTTPIDRTVAAYVCKRFRDAVRGKSLINGGRLWRAAARYGYVNIYVWADRLGFANIDILANAAIIHGQLAFLKYLETKHRYRPSIDSCSLAAKSGQLKVLKWMSKRCRRRDGAICTGAAMHGHVEVLKWAVKEGYYCSYRIRLEDDQF